MESWVFTNQAPMGWIEFFGAFHGAQNEFFFSEPTTWRYLVFLWQDRDAHWFYGVLSMERARSDRRRPTKKNHTQADIMSTALLIRVPTVWWMAPSGRWRRRFEASASLYRRPFFLELPPPPPPPVRSSVLWTPLSLCFVGMCFFFAGWCFLCISVCVCVCVRLCVTLSGRFWTNRTKMVANKIITLDKVFFYEGGRCLRFSLVPLPMV